VGKWERRAYGVAPTGSQTATQVAAVKANEWVEFKVAEDLKIKTNRYVYAVCVLVSLQFSLSCFSLFPIFPHFLVIVA